MGESSPAGWAGIQKQLDFRVEITQTLGFDPNDIRIGLKPDKRALGIKADDPVSVKTVIVADQDAVPAYRAFSYGAQ